MAYSIGSFNEEAELKRLKEKEIGEIPIPDTISQPPLASAKGPAPSVIGGKSLATAGAAGTSQATLQQIQEETLSVTSHDRLKTAPQPRLFNEADAIFERMIIIIPYRAPETVMQIEQSFERINMQKLGFDNVRYLNTKEFTEDERKNRRLDFIGGFELMDQENRIYIFEGLGG